MPDVVPYGCGQLYLPPMTIIGGSEILSESFKNFANDQRALTLFAQRNSEAWAEVSINSARRSNDLYAVLTTGAVLAGQTGVTSNQQTTSPRRTGAADTDSAGSATAARSVDNATAGTAQGASVAQTAAYQQILQALSDNNALIAKFLAQSAPSASTTGATANQTSA